MMRSVRQRHRTPRGGFKPGDDVRLNRDPFRGSEFRGVWRIAKRDNAQEYTVIKKGTRGQFAWAARSRDMKLVKRGPEMEDKGVPEDSFLNRRLS